MMFLAKKMSFCRLASPTEQLWSFNISGNFCSLLYFWATRMHGGGGENL